jgi:hypothetical protein
MLDREDFDPKELTDGELLDRVYDLVSDNEIPAYQVIDLIRNLLAMASTHD